MYDTDSQPEAAYEKADDGKRYATTARSLIAEFQASLKQHELSLTEAALKVNSNPEQATLILAGLVRDFRQLAGMAREVTVHAKIASEALSDLRVNSEKHMQAIYARLELLGSSDA